MGNFTVCERCGAREGLTIHHVYPQCHYEGTGPTARLCRSCHIGIENVYRLHESKVSNREGHEPRVDIGESRYQEIWEKYRDELKHPEYDYRSLKTEVRGSRGATLNRRGRR